MSNTYVDDFSILSLLENITILHIGNDYSDVKIKDIGFLKNMKNLENLSLNGDETTENFTALGELVNLRYFTMRNCINISESEVLKLSQLTKMESIDLMDNNLKTLPDMTGWINLQSVNFMGNRITEEEAIVKLPEHITSQENWRNTTGLFAQMTDEDNTNDNTQEGNIGNNETTDGTQEGETGTNEANNNTGEDETGENEDDTRILTSASDDSISAEGSLESGIYLEAKRIEDTSDYKELIERVQSRVTDIMETSIYDIWLYKKEIKEGENIKIKVQPNGNVKVMIKIEEQKDVSYHVFRQEEDDTLTKLDCNVEDGTLIFYSEHFSIFTVVISRLMNDEENGTEGNSHKSDNGNYIKVQQQGLNVPLLHEAEGNGGGIAKAKPTDKIQNGDNEGNENNSGSGNGISTKDENNSTLWENEIKEADKPAGKIKDTGNGEQDNKIDGTAGIVIVSMVGAGLLGYDIIKRKRGDYMRNFQMEASKTDLDIRQ